MANNPPSFEVDGIGYPMLGSSLQSLVITWARAGEVSIAATFNDWGAVDDGPPNFLWSDGRIVRNGVTMAVRLGTEEPIHGTVAMVESHLGDSTAPMFGLRASGRSPVERSAGPRTLRWGNDVHRMDAAIEAAGPNRTTRRLSVESPARVALGPEALRPGRPIDIVGAGDMFNGRYVLTEISLQFDPVAGLKTQFTARGQ